MSAGTEVSALTAETRQGKRAAATSAAAGDTSRETAAVAGRALALVREEETAADRGQRALTRAAHPVEAEDITREATLPKEANRVTVAEAEATAAAIPAPLREETRGQSPPKSRPPRAMAISARTE